MKKEKKLDLVGEETHAGAEFWSPAKIQRARVYTNDKEAEKTQEEQKRQEQKAQQAKNKRKKDEDKAERSKQWKIKLAGWGANRAQKEEEKKARQQREKEKEKKSTAQTQPKGSKKALSKAKQPESRPIDSVAPVEEEEVVVMNSRGRRIHPHPYRVE